MNILGFQANTATNLITLEKYELVSDKEAAEGWDA
jgi:hypothetical protein